MPRTISAASIRSVVLVFLAVLGCSAGIQVTEAAVSEAAEGGAATVVNSAPAPTQTAYLPLVTENASSQKLMPADFEYLGAFRLPEGGERPLTFGYAHMGSSMTYNPQGDPAGGADGFLGSLFIMGHERLPYGELPNGSQVAEVSIPQPVKSSSLEALNRAAFVQDFADVAAGFFTTLDWQPRTAMLYLDHPATGAKIHLAWGAHFQDDDLQRIASHAWFDPNLSAPNMQGTWFIGSQDFYSVNGYLLEIPAAWADAYASGRYIGTGRYRDGGWSGMGPSLFAYRPWVDAAGTPAPSGTRLPETALLSYEKSSNTEQIERCLNGYQHPDEWEGAAWITTSSGKAAVLFAGNKATGAKYWYGFINPAGAQFPCVHGASVGQFPVCHLANGQLCPPEDVVECANHTSERGWWSSGFDAQFILYDPADLAKVASGQMQSWEPQPYASLGFDQVLLMNPSGVELELIGSGDQRRYLIGEIAFDRANGLLYVLELFADEAQPVVHVWRVR